MTIMTVHVFLVLAFQEQKWYMYRYLRKPKTKRVYTLITRLIKLNNYLPYFSLDCFGQMVTVLPDNDVKEILYHAMPNWWRKKRPNTDITT